jgi:hypothetical protein
MIELKKYNITLKIYKKQLEYLDNALNFEDHLQEQLQDSEFQVRNFFAKIL